MTITSALITILATCPSTVFQNLTNEPWTQYDYDTYHKAQVRCKELDEEQFCVKLFKKYKPLQYTVICGSPD